MCVCEQKPKVIELVHSAPSPWQNQALSAALPPYEGLSEMVL